MVGLVAQMQKGLALQVGILKHSSFLFIISFIIRATSLLYSFSLHIDYNVPLTVSCGFQHSFTFSVFWKITVLENKTNPT